MSWSISFAGAAKDAGPELERQHKDLKEGNRHEEEYKDIDRAKKLIEDYCADHNDRTVNGSVSGHADLQTGYINVSLKYS